VNGRHALQAITSGRRRQPSQERVSATAVCIEVRAARQKSHNLFHVAKVPIFAKSTGHEAIIVLAMRLR